MLALDCFEESVPWWWVHLGSGFSDNVSHILVGVCHGCCSRVMARGLEMRVLDGVNARSLAGSGFESFAVVRCIGFMDGDCSGNLHLG